MPLLMPVAGSTPKRRLTALAGPLLLCLAAGAAQAGPPDKIVIVIEENHGIDQVIGSAQAPYMNGLAASGASFTNLYAVTHPSQPNYLELYSGSNQGVTSDSLPTGIPYTTPNLGAELLAAGKSFAIFSQGLPSIGSNVASSGSYFRKHNPVANWQAAAPGLNQYAITYNRRFTDFPSDYTQLPSVSIVVPDQLNDMHDGTIAQADTWLSQNLGPYIAWATAHNSVLILTWDEDGNTSRNRIPTIVVGAGVRQGTFTGCYTLHDILRTMENWMGTTSHAGSAASVQGIVGVLASDPVVTTVSFAQGENGYAGGVDTYIEQAAPAANHGGDTVLVADGSPLSQVLVRFDSIIGPTLVPAGATVVSAKLRILTGSVSGDLSASRMEAHRMLAPWTATSNWNSLVNGVSLDDAEAASATDFSALPNTLTTWTVFDVTGSVQAWVSGSGTNNGWVISPTGTDGWRMASNEVALADRPRLDVTYYVPACPSFTTQPQPTLVCPGTNVTLSVAATGNPPPTWQWRKDGAPISGETSSTLNLGATAPGDTGVYDCVATNGCSSVPSDPALVQVCVANVNCDDTVDLGDFFAFFNCFDVSDPCADIDGEPGVDLADFFAFLNGFDTGC